MCVISIGFLSQRLGWSWGLALQAVGVFAIDPLLWGVKNLMRQNIRRPLFSKVRRGR